jgi:MOSC domain-containing protein YiiM
MHAYYGILFWINFYPTPMQQLIKGLQKTYFKNGRVENISIRPARRTPVQFLDSVHAIENAGLTGDHYASPGGPRQVTFIQAEHLDVIAALLNLSTLNPALTRRNIVVSGINLLSLKGASFRIGEAVFEYSGECHPCSRMEENLGSGGYNAMRGHGGITARVITGGTVCVGDAVEVVNTTTH